MLFIPFLDPWLQPSVRDLSPGKKEGFRTCLVWPFWVSGCRACAEVPRSAAAQNVHWSHPFCGAGC